MSTEPLLSPIGGNPMTVVTFEGCTIYRDPDTGGHWLPRTELEKLTHHQFERELPPILEINEQSMQHSGRFSPESGLELVEYEFAQSGIKIEQDLSTKGIWLDAGELAKLMQYVYEHVEEFEIPDEPPERLTISERILLFLYAVTGNPPQL